MRINTSIERKGPLFNGLARREAKKAADEISWELAKQAKQDLGVRFIRVFKHPTGYYESRVRAEKRGGGKSFVHDSKVVYGPWLEGTGSRNAPVTRFRGYFSFAIVARELQAKAKPIAERVLQPFIQRMNGRP